MRVLIIGLGSIAKKHIKALKTICFKSPLEIFALRSSKESKSFEDVINVFSFEDIPEIENLDFCIISSPTSKHQEHIEMCLNYDFPIFIEKPLSHTLEVGKFSLGMDNRKTYIACNLRFLESLNFVKHTYLSDGNSTINEVSSYCGSYLPDWRPEQDYKRTYSSIPNLGGGVHLDLIHELDYLFWLFGEPEHTSKYLSTKSSLDIKAIDAAYYFMDYPSFNCNVSLNYFRRTPKRSLEIVFDDKTIFVDLIKNQVFCDHELVFESSRRISDTYENQLRYFIKEDNPFNDFDEALKVLSLCIK